MQQKLCVLAEESPESRVPKDVRLNDLLFPARSDDTYETFRGIRANDMTFSTHIPHVYHMGSAPGDTVLVSCDGGKRTKAAPVHGSLIRDDTKGVGVSPGFAAATEAILTGLELDMHRAHLVSLCSDLVTRHPDGSWKTTYFSQPPCLVTITFHGRSGNRQYMTSYGFRVGDLVDLLERTGFEWWRDCDGRDMHLSLRGVYGTGSRGYFA